MLALSFLYRTGELIYTETILMNGFCFLLWLEFLYFTSEYVVGGGLDNNIAVYISAEIGYESEVGKTEHRNCTSELKSLSF